MLARVQHILQSTRICRKSLASGLIKFPSLCGLYLLATERCALICHAVNLSLSGHYWFQFSQWTRLSFKWLKVYELPKDNYLSEELWSHQVRFFASILLQSSKSTRLDECGNVSTEQAPCSLLLSCCFNLFQATYSYSLRQTGTFIDYV